MAMISAKFPCWRAVGCGAILALAFCAAAHADPDPTAQREIDHLLDYVGASSCSFVRNGETFPAAKARDHLAMKYRFTRSRLSTAEDFIQYLATDSSTSHEPYKIVCGAQERLAGPWLSEELARYRKTVATK
jgi:acetyl esterase/lipase